MGPPMCRRSGARVAPCTYAGRRDVHAEPAKRGAVRASDNARLHRSPVRPDARCSRSRSWACSRTRRPLSSGARSMR